MDGFGNSKDRNKHFKKHVQGKPPNAYKAGDMSGMFPTALAYEQGGVNLFNQPTSFGGTIQIPPHPNPMEQRQSMVMRWNKTTHEFGTGDPTTRRLATYHTRTPDEFLEAVSLQRPDVLPRVIKFEKK